MANRVRNNTLNNNFEINVIDWDQNKLQKFVALLIVGYFGVKILYGLFGKYSKKPMRDEMVDFSVMLIMAGVLYILTNINQRALLGRGDAINPFFFVGYLVGLNMAFVYQETISNEDIANNKFLQYLFYVLFIFIVLVMVYLSIQSSRDGGNPLYYIMYLIVIAFLVMGIIITRQKPRIYQATKFDKNLQNTLDNLGRYFDTDKMVQMIDTKEFRQAAQTAAQTNDTKDLTNVLNQHFDMNTDEIRGNMDDIMNSFISLNKPITETGYLNVHGTYISFGLAMVGWLLSLLFMYDADNTILQRFLTSFNGFTLGLFVSGVSFYGFSYLLADQREKKCFGDECRRSDMILKNKEYEDVVASLSTMKWGLSFTIIILLVTIILFYMLRF